MESGSGGRRKRRLSLEAIVSCTLALIDEQGISSATMRSVAARLGVEAMSLYRYVQNRDQLFDQVVQRVVDELSADPDVRDRPVEGWRDYLERLARGVRRYARAHPHAFPLVATRPPEAPWLNPPLRSLRWVESLLEALHEAGFNDDQVLFTYRSFNSFLLGYLLLETSALTLVDLQAGDGAFSPEPAAHDPNVSGDGERTDSADPVPGAVAPTRSPRQRHAIDQADGARDLVDPMGMVSMQEYPEICRLADGLAQDRFPEEFDAALKQLLNRIELVVTS